MIVAGSASPLLLSSGGYNLTKSLRFRSSASAYLNRTPASAGNRKTFTISAWVKRAKLGSPQPILVGFNGGSQYTSIGFNGSDQIYIPQDNGSGGVFYPNTAAVFRDPSAWYHVVVAFDTTQATDTNRLKVYVNNVQQTLAGGAIYPSQNADTWINIANTHFLGAWTTVAEYTEGYLTEVNFIDGQALTPSSFGQTSATTGVWIPKKYTGTYGTNGFYLPFTDVATTSGSNAGLGKDFSGNSNYWTTNNISVTSGSTYDSMKDVPTLTDTDTANYCVLNPLWKGANITLSAGNLDASATSLGSNQAAISTIFASSGKWYFEYTQNTDSNSNLCVGIADTSFNATNNYVGGTATTYGYVAKSNYKFNNGSLTSYGSGSSANGDVLMCAYDLDNGKIYFGKNGTWYGSGDPVAGTNAAFTGISGTYCPAYSHNAGSSQSTSASFNFGQRPFAYTPPSGFKALNTFNLPTPTIGATASTQANKYMDATLYTGTGTTAQNIVNAGSFQPDFVWIKSRSNAYYNELFDVIRGVNKPLFSNDTLAEASRTGMTAFNSNGFTVQDNGTTNQGTNAPSATFVGWQWKANGSGSSNTSGSITSTVSANTSAGFSICTFSKGNASNQTFGHGLGVAPKFIIYKNKGATSDWWCYHESLGNTKSINLNLTSAAGTDTTYWNSTSPTSTVATMGTYWSAGDFVAYCFAQIAGYSAFGSYTGNGSSDGPFVFTGFRPRFVLVKRTDSTSSWGLIDTARDTYNVTTKLLFPNASDAENTSYTPEDILSNGFKLRDTTYNISSGTYIYMAFCESPFKYANAR